MIHDIMSQKQLLTADLQPCHVSGIFLRSPKAPLVWYRNHKAASTLYHDFFRRQGWRHCDAATINWDEEQVFGHLRDPVVKYLKGMATAFESRNADRRTMLSLITQHPQCQRFLSELQGFDIHTQTIQYHLGYHAKDVYWILMDSPYVDHKMRTFQLLDSFDQAISPADRSWLIDAPAMNRSSAAESELYNNLRSSPLTPLTRQYLMFDQQLYDIVVNWHEQNFIQD
jgi:hypothetical protein